MTRLRDSGSFLRRDGDLPILVLSQDYELFFGASGSVEKCMLEPAAMLADWANKRGCLITFYIDAGMLCAMERFAESDASLQNDLSLVKAQIESLANDGHEIGLHIHPHWEDTRRENGAWNFSKTRYKLADFGDDEIADIVARYTVVLNELCDGAVSSYRAGGFCVEPFGRWKQHLLNVGVATDSSVVPGLEIDDAEKGVTFPASLNQPWWFFDESPAIPSETGDFLEISITPQVLPLFHYWGRALERLLGIRPPSVSGDGSSKAIGRKEILRRLTGHGRTSELSSDAAKARRLLSGSVPGQSRNIWHVMGHPKLLGKASLDSLEKFIDRKEIAHYATVADLAAAIRAQSQ